MTIEPSLENGLHTTSQIMINKVMTVRTNKLGATFGQVGDTTMLDVNRAPALFLGIAE